MTDHITSHSQDGVGTITINRPDAMNAFTLDMLQGLKAAIETLSADRSLSVIVLEGAGRCFSAGADLRLLQGQTPIAGRIADQEFDGTARAMCRAIRMSPIPVIAKVHGFCFTGGLEIALHCDLIYTTVDTKFGDTHTKFALRPSWGMSQTLARAVGLRRAKELTFTARTFTGKDAKEWGMANEAAADKDALDSLVDSYAAAIAKNSPGSIRAHQDLYKMSGDFLPLEEGLAEEIKRDYPVITDTAERLKAFK